MQEVVSYLFYSFSYSISYSFNDDNFGNARYARNLYEKCIIKHASNCKDVSDKERLETILKEDIVEIL